MRRECLDHLVIFNERHLRRVFISYLDYYHRTRTHLSLDKDCPEQRPYRCSKSEKSSPSPKSVVCTIATSASRRDSSHSPMVETRSSDSAGSRDRFLSQLLPRAFDAAAATGATSSTHFLLAELFSLSRLLKVSVQIEFSAGTGLDITFQLELCLTRKDRSAASLTFNWLS